MGMVTKLGQPDAFADHPGDTGGEQHYGEVLDEINAVHGSGGWILVGDENGVQGARCRATGNT